MSGNQRETWVFEELQGYDYATRRNKSIGDNDNIPRAESEKEAQRKYYRKQVQHNVRRLINENYVPGRTSFLTLTFREDIEDLKEANRRLSNFFKKLKYRLEHQVKPSELKYIWCWEIQENGERAKRGLKVIHYHVVLFDIGYIPHKDLEKMWGQGFIMINQVENKLDDLANVGRYITKYFTKAFEDSNLYKVRYWNKSANLEHAKRKRALLGGNELNARIMELERDKQFYSDYIAKMGNKQYVVRYYIHNIKKGVTDNEKECRAIADGTGEAQSVAQGDIGRRYDSGPETRVFDYGGQYGLQECTGNVGALPRRNV